MTTIYEARRIVTMNPSRPFATHVAVRDGKFPVRAVSTNWLAGVSTGWIGFLQTRS